MNLDIEIRDAGTRDYWTRVNYATVVPPGRSTLIIPLKQLYVGEKSRPGRMLILGKITRLVFSIGDKPAAPFFWTMCASSATTRPSRVGFAGLQAFDFGPDTSPVMDGFTPITPATQYSPGRGYGLEGCADLASVRRAPARSALPGFYLHRSAAGWRSTYPTASTGSSSTSTAPRATGASTRPTARRAILAEGRPVVNETMDFEAFKAKYYRFWNVEDRPDDVTFDKYQKAYFDEKRFDVEVTDGQLNLDFQGENWACCVSAVVIFPVSQATQGEEFLDYVQSRRRFYFDNYFKRVLHPPHRRSASGERRRSAAGLRRLSARLHAGRLLQ